MKKLNHAFRRHLKSGSKRWITLFPYFLEDERFVPPSPSMAKGSEPKILVELKTDSRSQIEVNYPKSHFDYAWGGVEIKPVRFIQQIEFSSELREIEQIWGCGKQLSLSSMLVALSKGPSTENQKITPFVQYDNGEVATENVD